MLFTVNGIDASTFITKVLSMADRSLHWLIQAILNLLNKNIVPVVPLRGSISASGDLSPLSYIAGAIEGSPDIYVRVANGKILSAAEALRDAGIEHVTFQLKEGLGLLNGTAFSAATASLALHQCRRSRILVAYSDCNEC